MTDAVDSLEDALQFKIQKQEMADKLQAAETQLKSIKEAYRRLQSSQSGSTSAHITLAHQVEACEAEKMALKSKLNELTADVCFISFYVMTVADYLFISVFQVQAMTGKLQTSENRLKALQEGYQARIESLCREVVSIRNRLDVREYAYENLSHRLRSQEELCEQATVKAKDYEEKLKDALNEKAAQMEQSKESVAKVEALQKELDTMWEVRRSLRHTNTASQKELERARVELRDADRKAALAAKLEQELTTSKRMQQSLQADLERSKAEQRALKAELEGLKSPKSPKVC
jgi:chromosome segregation ATPase